jgi:hypothetical protein
MQQTPIVVSGGVVTLSQAQTQDATVTTQSGGTWIQLVQGAKITATSGHGGN